jgi:hypothetical protein
MLLFTWTGTQLGNFLKRKNKANIKKGGASISPLSGLLFFMMAFTFGMSGTRYESRKAVVVQEANNIGTALLRADLYPEEERVEFRKDFQAYIEARIDYFEASYHIEKILIADSLSQVISARLWNRAARLSNDSNNLVSTQQMIPALNSMIDIVTERKAGELAKVPETIVFMLFALACVNAFYLGYASVDKNKLDWVVAGGFCLLISLVVMITLDLDRPRRGFINLNDAHQNIVDLRKSFK